MRNESVLEFLKRIAAVEPGIWRDMQKNSTKLNEASGAPS